MRRQIMALMDSEPGYAVSFMEYANRQMRMPFEVRAFTDATQLHVFLLKHRAAVLLVAEADLTKEMAGWTEGQKVILTGDRQKRDGYIFKYQAASAVIREVMRIYGGADISQMADGTEGGLLKRSARVIGVFSPVGRCMKTAFAVTLGQCLARKKPTILLNLECGSAFCEILHVDYEQDLSDAVYYLRSGEKNPVAKMMTMVRSVGGLDYLPPFRSARELFLTTDEEWEKMITVLQGASSYEAVLIDFGVLPIASPALLDLCDLIYMPERQDYMARMKIRAFLDQPYRITGPEDGEGSATSTEMTLEERLGERIRRLRLNDQSLPASGDRWFESMPFGRLGDCAEECIARDEL